MAPAGKSQGEGRGRIRTPRQSRSPCDTAGARGWLGSWMTHPQWSPETLVGSFAKQVFSLTVSALGAGSNPALAGLLQRPLLATAHFGACWGTPLRLAQGLGDPSPSPSVKDGTCCLVFRLGGGRTRVFDGGGYLSTAITIKPKTGKLPQLRVLSPPMEEPR